MLGLGVVSYTGDTPKAERQTAVEKFQNDPKTHIFVGNIHAAGTAITLHSASDVLFVEIDWVNDNNMQAYDRCHRIGQLYPVSGRALFIPDSVDEKVFGIARRKKFANAQLFA
jgi:SNF2 family DNA or RNA helicase